jgi:hypothetical protein
MACCKLTIKENKKRKVPEPGKWGRRKVNQVNQNEQD